MKRFEGIQKHLIDRLARKAGLSRDQVRGFWYMLPLILFLTLFILVPVLGTVVNSFFRDIIFLPKKYVFLENFRVMFSDPSFWTAFRFTTFFVLVSVPVEVVFGLAMALVLNEPVRMRGLIRACVLIPWAIPAAVSGRVFELIYNYSYGAANSLLMRLNITQEPINWLGSDMGSFFAVVAADAWKTTPFAAIILLAGLSSIPETLYAQSRVDQANLFRRFYKITLPLLKPVLLVTILFRTIQVLIVFDVIFILTGGGPGGATESLSLFAYKYFSAGDYGYGSAASVILFGLAIILAVFCVKSGNLKERS